MMPTEQATPIAIPRFIPGRGESSAGAVVTTPGPEVSVGVDSGEGAMAASRSCCVLAKLNVERRKLNYGETFRVDFFRETL